MRAGAHIFIVTPETYEVHRDFRFCAVGKLPKEEGGQAVARVPATMEEFETSPEQKKHHSLIADLWNVGIGDFVFFYVTNRGFTGVYRASSPPFFDATPVGDVIGPERPFRLLIEPVIVLDHPVPEEHLFRTPESQNAFWVWYFAKMRNRPRACHAIDPGGRDRLIELLLKQNYGQIQPQVVRRYPGSPRYVISDLRTAHEKEVGRCALEDTLRAEVLRGLRDGTADVSLIGGEPAELEWFANNVPYHVSGRNIDILMFHRARPFSPDLPISPRVQYSVVELKRDDAGKADLEQLLGYCEWVGSQLAAGEFHTVQPLLIANSFTKDTQSFARSVRTSFKPIKLVTYRVKLGQLQFSSIQQPADFTPARRPPQFSEEPTDLKVSKRRSAGG